MTEMKHTLVVLDEGNTLVFMGSEDAKAVMGAKTSRAPDIHARFAQLWRDAGGEEWDINDPPPAIKRFLAENLLEYNHASIAEMGNGWVASTGMGWPGCWILEDFPLFIGQECSTRAVDMTKFKGKGEMCLYTHANPNLHKQWMDLYKEVVSEAERGVYRYDYARCFLPGTARSGVTMVMPVRTAIRHLLSVAKVSDDMFTMAHRYIRGFEVQAPECVNAVMKSPKVSYLGDFDYKPLKVHTNTKVTSAGMVRVKHTRNGGRVGEFTYPTHTPKSRPGPRTYLDPKWKTASRFTFRVTGTIGALRDWHRHRPVMPWHLTIHHDEKLRPIFAPWLVAGSEGLADEVDFLMSSVATEFHRLCNFLEPQTGYTFPWDALHALPYGALGTIECTATLPDLLYMLELRAFATGGLEEYREQATEGLRQLIELLPEHVVKEESIVSKLKAENKEDT